MRYILHFQHCHGRFPGEFKFVIPSFAATNNSETFIKKPCDSSHQRKQLQP